MPDLGEELQRIASEAGQAARPLPVAQVMRIGGRRRRLRVARDALAAVVVASAITAGILSSSAVRSHPGPGRPASPAAPPTRSVTGRDTRSPAPVPTPSSPAASPPAASPSPTGQPIPSPSPLPHTPRPSR